MAYNDIKHGSKVEIWVLQESNRAVNKGTDAKSYASKVFEINDDGTIDIDLPTFQGKPVVLSPTLRYSFIFINEGNMRMAEGVVTKNVKRENFLLLRISLLTKLEKFQRRAFYRLPVHLPLSFQTMSITEAEVEEALVEGNKIIPDLESDWFLGTINDISGGGLRFVSETVILDTEYLFVQFELNDNNKTERVGLVAKLLDRQPIPNTRKNTYRVRFQISDRVIQEKIIQFIFAEQRRIRRKQQGLK